MEAGPESARLARSLRLTPAGRSLLAFAGAGVLASAAFGGVIGLIPASALMFLTIAIFATWLQSRCVEAVEVSRLVCFAGDESPLRLELRNRSRWMALRDVAIAQGNFSCQRPRPNALIAEIAPRRSRLAEYQVKLNERGRFSFFEMTISSTYPLGLVEYRRSFRLSSDHLVLPRLGTVRPIADRLERHRGFQREARRTLLGSEEFFGLREWREGESQRLVHWKVSARRGKLMVRELRGEDRTPVHLVLLTRVPGQPVKRHPGFEVAVSLAATLCEQLLRERFRLRLTLMDSDRPVHDFARGRASLFDALSELATIRPSFELPLGSARARIREVFSPGETVIAVFNDGQSGSEEGAGPLLIDVESDQLEEVFSRLRRNDGLSLLSQAGALD